MPQNNSSLLSLNDSSVKEQISTKQIIKVVSLPKTNTSTSLFTHHLLKPITLKTKLHATEDLIWMSWLMLGIFVLFAWLKIAYGKKFKQIINAFTVNGTATQLMREEQALSNRLSVFLSIIFVLAGSLFIYQVDSFYNRPLFQQSGFMFYMKLCLIVSLIYFIKIVSVKFLGTLFKTENQASEYIFNIFLFNKMAGLFLLPIVIGIAFLKDIPVIYSIDAGLILLILMFLYRSIRGLIDGIRNSKISKFYLFVYLCTLEILPLLVLVKIIISKNIIF